MGVIPRVHINNSRPRAVGSALVVLRESRLFLAILLHRPNLHIGLGEQSEELWEFRLHPRDVAAECRQNLLSRCWRELGIRLQRVAEGLEVGEPQLGSDCEFFALNAGYLLQANLMDSLRLHSGRGE